jgi:hypothetical protein
MSTPVSDYRSLISGLNWNGSEVFGKSTVLIYSFSQAIPYYMLDENPSYAATFAALNDFEKGIIRQALSQWSSVSGLTFVESANRVGDLNFSFVDMDAIGVGAAAAAGLGAHPAAFDFRDSEGKLRAYSTDYRAGGDVWFGTDYRASAGYEADLITVALHEIGHALGLKHPHDVMPGHQEVLDPDPVGSTVMSYQYRPTVLGPIDIAAIQYLYGPPGGATDWTLDLGKERVAFTGTSAAEVIRGTAWDDIIHGNGGADIISSSMGNDRIFVGSGEVTAKGGDGIDLAYSLAKSGGRDKISGNSDWSYLYLDGTFQSFEAIEYIHFSDGLFDTAKKAFVSKQIVDQFEIAHRQIARVEPGHIAIEQAATSGQTASAYIKALLAGEAKDSTIPSLVVYDAMLSRTPDAAGLDGLAAFVHSQVFSKGYQATANPRLGGYEAMGLALADLSPVITANSGQSESDFVRKSYATIFGHAATEAQVNHFVSQVDYFESLYIGVGIPDAAASVKARGAAYGQMLGFAAEEAGNSRLADAQQTLLGFLKSAGGGDWMV